MNKKVIKVETKGHNGKISFNIDLNNNHIDDIQVTESSETPAVFKQVFGKLKSKIIKEQSFDVDAISGASVMTGAILKSGKSALIKNNISLDSSIQNTQKNIDKKKMIKVDVAVIGSGMAGLMSACRALSMGKKVIILEKNGYLGGATVLNGSNVVGTGSRVSQKIFGLESNDDSPERLIDDIARECHGTNYSVLTDLLADNIGSSVDFISDFAKLKYEKAETQTIEHSVNRQIEMPSESSYELVTKIAKAFEDKEGKILLDTRVEKVNKDSEGKVCSLIAKNKHQTIYIEFKSLVLAAGGWGARIYKSERLNIPYYGPMTSTGDYFDFNVGLNLVTRNSNWVKVYPHGIEVEPGIAKLTTYSTKKVTDMGAIFVNSEGKRITNEAAPYTHFRDAIAKQKNLLAFIIMDEKMWTNFYNLMLKYSFTKSEIQSFFELKGEKSPILVSGDLATVAKEAGINYVNLKETMERYKNFVATKNDTEFHKPSKYLHPYLGNKFYAIEQKLRFCTTLGGYITNDKMQLLDKSMKPVPNYFAAGEIIGGANGHDSMPSMMNSWSYASGFVAGTAAADNTNFNV